MTEEVKTEEAANVPATQAEGGALVVSEFEDMMLANQGKGLENLSAQDMVVPYLTLLGTLS